MILYFDEHIEKLVIQCEVCKRMGSVLRDPSIALETQLNKPHICSRCAKSNPDMVSWCDSLNSLT